MYEELKARLRENASQYVGHTDEWTEAAEAIEQLERQLAEYLDAPVVAWIKANGDAVYLDKQDAVFSYQPLIVKPGE